ncbi:rRNA maturation RNase YbeY [bacterium]|nr:rRNA maturation RNase YbeY [bacterium]HDJ30512.1 rRNA maturation RNase YbeY [bacterium]
MIEINNLTSVSIDQEFLKKIAEGVLEKEHAQKKDISLAFVGPGRMKQINRRYRGKNRVTDVLAFPETRVEFDEFTVKDLYRDTQSLGEIIICLKEVKKNSRRYKSDFKTELARVLIHGILHLLGYDHERSEKDAAEMQEKENQYLSQFLKD